MEELAFWRNVALVYLIIQFFVFIVIGVAISYLLVRVSATLHIHAEKAAHKAQEYSAIAVEKTEEYTEKVRQPVAQTSARGTGIVTGLRTLLRGDQNQSSAAAPPASDSPQVTPPISPSVSSTGSKS